MELVLSDQEIHVTFLNEKMNEEITLQYQLYDHPFIERWLQVFSNSSFACDTFRSVNFAGQPFDDEDFLVATLNGLILKINAFVISKNRPDLVITHTVEKKVQQTILNDLHKFFEAKVYEDFYRPVFKTLQLLNFFIHKMENFSDGKINNCGIIGIAPTSVEYHSLEDDDYKLFSSDWTWGELKLSYPHVGVPTLEAFKNQTRPVPQHQYTAGMILTFVEDSKFNQDKELEDWLKTIDLKPNDPKNALGYISLGMLKQVPSSDEEKLSFLKKLSHFRRIKRITRVRP